VLPHLEVAAHDEDGRRLDPGREGELRISAAGDGPWAGRWRPPLGYWEHGALRRAGPGVVVTGDVGWVDADGWLTMVDRKKLMIVRGGANVSPAEVESVLMQHPSVGAAVVFGLPDDRLGERVAALVLPGDAGVDSAALASFCSGRLARYKIPEVWGRPESLPVNAMGKIIRTGLPDVLRSSPPL
jgi:acyl-CoA synthetase (AMP-forming)/AMP-acid ligase II